MPLLRTETVSATWPTSHSCRKLLEAVHEEGLWTLHTAHHGQKESEMSSLNQGIDCVLS